MFLKLKGENIVDYYRTHFGIDLINTIYILIELVTVDGPSPCPRLTLISGLTRGRMKIFSQNFPRLNSHILLCTVQVINDQKKKRILPIWHL